MGAVNLLCMKPDIRFHGILACQLVILPVAAAHQNSKARRAAKLPRGRLALKARLFSAPTTNIAAVGQFGPDVVEVLLRLCLRKFLQDTFQIQKFPVSFFNLFRQYFLGSFCLVILFEISGGFS